MNRSKLWATGLLAGAFILGIVVGSAATALADRLDDGGGRPKRPRYIERVQVELGLSAEQRSQAQAILDEHGQVVEAIWRESRTRFEQTRANVRARIADILDDQQRVTYERMNARSDSLRAEHRKKHDKN